MAVLKTQISKTISKHVLNILEESFIKHVSLNDFIFGLIAFSIENRCKITLVYKRGWSSKDNVSSVDGRARFEGYPLRIEEGYDESAGCDYVNLIFREFQTHKELNLPVSSDPSSCIHDLILHRK